MTVINNRGQLRAIAWKLVSHTPYAPEVVFTHKNRKRDEVAYRSLIAKILIDHGGNHSTVSVALGMSESWAFNMVPVINSRLKWEKPIQDKYRALLQKFKSLTAEELPALDDIPNDPRLQDKPEYTIEEVVAVIGAIASFYGLEVEDIQARTKGMAEARSMVAKFLREQMQLSFTRISSILGKSIPYACNAVRMINERIDYSEELQYRYAEILDLGHEAIESLSLDVSKAA